MEHSKPDDEVARSQVFKELYGLPGFFNVPYRVRIRIIVIISIIVTISVIVFNISLIVRGFL